MPRSLWTAASGMSAQQTNVDVIANNIANVSTNGFKRQVALFQDLFYDIAVAPGGKAGDLGRNPTGTQIGTGVRLSSTPRVFTPGQIEPTGVQTDMAIEGDGLFQVQLPDGTTAYTRAGDFRVDADGSLVTPEGYYLEPRITIPDQASQISISTTGVVTATVNNAETTVGTVTLARFRNNAGLLAQGSNLFRETAASGAPITGNAGASGYGNIRQSSLEKANVEIVTELVDLITAQRAYELNSKSIKTSDQMLSTANDLVR